MTIDDMRRDFEENTIRLAKIGGYDPDNELRRKPNGNYFEPRIQAAWMGWQDCWKLLHTRPVPAGLVEKLEALKTDADNPTDDYDDNIIDRCIEIVKAHAQPASYQDYTWEDVAMLVQENRMLKAAQPAAGVKQVDECPDCGAPMMEVCSGLEKAARNDDLGKCRYAEMHEPTSHEQAKQPVRVDVYEACKAYMQVAHPMWNPDKPLFKGEKPNWELYADGIRAVLSVVKDAAKEMGVEVTYE